MTTENYTKYDDGNFFVLASQTDQGGYSFAFQSAGLTPGTALYAGEIEFASDHFYRLYRVLVIMDAETLKDQYSQLFSSLRLWRDEQMRLVPRRSKWWDAAWMTMIGIGFVRGADLVLQLVGVHQSIKDPIIGAATIVLAVPIGVFIWPLLEKAIRDAF